LNELWENMPPLADVKAKLEEWGVWDDGLDESGAFKRYVRFEGLDLGVVPPEAWPKLRRDLLEFEPYLAAEQHDVGLVSEFPFRLEPRKDTQVHQKPTPLPPKRREWVNREIEQLLKAEVVKRASTARFTSKVVLVEEGQDGQDFRMCINFVDVN
jgi:hypothetical protein